MADLEDILKRIRTRPPLDKARVFPVPGRSFTQKPRIDAVKQRDRLLARRFVRPENATALVADLPAGDDSLHALLPGDFVFGDFLAAVIQSHGPPTRLDIATLSLSHANLATLLHLARTHATPIHLLLSHYFRHTSKPIFAALRAAVAPLPQFRLTIGRNHCKVLLLDYPDRPWVIEGSANLRSSRNLEQITVLCSRGLLEFHRAWMEESATAFDSEK